MTNSTTTPEASGRGEQPDCVCEFDPVLQRIIFCEFHLEHENLVQTVDILRASHYAEVKRLREALHKTIAAVHLGERHGGEIEVCANPLCADALEDVK